jgi:hypothetical protein
MYRERVAKWAASRTEEKSCTPIIITHIVTATASPTAVSTVSDAITPTLSNRPTGQAAEGHGAAVHVVQDADEHNAAMCALRC